MTSAQICKCLSSHDAAPCLSVKKARKFKTARSGKVLHRARKRKHAYNFIDTAHQFPLHREGAGTPLVHTRVHLHRARAVVHTHMHTGGSPAPNSRHSARPSRASPSRPARGNCASFAGVCPLFPSTIPRLPPQAPLPPPPP